MPRRWRPTQRCARSCGATAAKAIARCWLAWPSESGIETPTAEDLIRLDRNRKGKKLSNADWESPTDPDARIARLKDGRTHLAYKPEHAMDLDTGAVVAAEVHAADQGDTTTMPGTLASAAEHLAAVDAAPTPEAPAELIADKGYHARDALKALDGGPWKSRISEPQRDAFSRWHGDDAARRAVYNNRARLRSGVARQAFKLRAELVERGFALILDRGGMRRVWLRGRENVQKRYLIHVAGYNLGLIMRLLTGAGTPREFQARASAWLFATAKPDGGLIVVMFVATSDQICRPRRHDQTRPVQLKTQFLNGLLGFARCLVILGHLRAHYGCPAEVFRLRFWERTDAAISHNRLLHRRGP